MLRSPPKFENASSFEFVVFDASTQFTEQQIEFLATCALLMVSSSCQFLNVCSFSMVRRTLSAGRGIQSFLSRFIVSDFLSTSEVSCWVPCSRRLSGSLTIVLAGQLIPTSRQLCFRSVKAPPSTTRTSGDMGTLQ